MTQNPLSPDDQGRGLPRPSSAGQPQIRPLPSGNGHVARTRDALERLDVERLTSWGQRLADILPAGGRLLAAGNGGSAAEAQHLTAELVGRMRDERRPLSAIALHADTSALTALGNDYGYDEVFARQVRAHGRPGDVLVLLSTSGSSANLLRAAETGRELGLAVWALTGPLPNPLAALCHEAVAVDADSTAAVQECHLVAVHLICADLDLALGVSVPESTDRLRESNGRLPVSAHRLPDGAARPVSSREHAPLVVVGDTLLDRDLEGVVRRLSPEAPVPVVDEARASSRPGGAGLAAVLAARQGREVVLVTAFGDDEEGHELARLLKEHGVETVDLGLVGPTPVKSRIRTDGRTLMMLSQATSGHAPLRRALTERERGRIERAGTLLVSDYGRGLTADGSVRAALEAAAPQVPIVWDPHPRGTEPVAGTRLVIPNSAEAAHFASSVRTTDLAGDIDRARDLLQRWAATAVAVTRGPRGAVMVDADGNSPLLVPVSQAQGMDTLGAGDAFGVAAATLLADGALVSESVVGAVEAAGRFVAGGGCAVLTADLAADRPEPETDPLAMAARVRARGGKVVATAGCFDLLHVGHVRLLENARRLGDFLIVCLNNDSSVRRLKGPTRPVVADQDRAALLNSLASVDGVVLFGEDTPNDVLERIRPDVYVKGGDYRIEDVPEAELISGWGGRCVILPYVHGKSTTSMIHKISGAPV